MSRFMMQFEGKARPLSFSAPADNPPVLASTSSLWAGVPFEIHDVPATEGPWRVAPPVGSRGLIITLAGAQTCAFELANRQRQTVMLPGTVSFVDPDSQVTVARATGCSRGMVFMFGLDSVWQEMFAEGGSISAAPAAVLPPSQTALALALAIASEVESGVPGGALFAESLSLALLRYVVERSPVARVPVRGSLSERERRRIGGFIDENLHKNLRLREIAAIAGLSSRHFSTLFRNAFGVPPHRYLVQRRVERGARLLSTTRIGIAELALSLGFSSQSHFSTAFRRQYGVSPRRYALSRRSSTSSS